PLLLSRSPRYSPPFSGRHGAFPNRSRRSKSNLRKFFHFSGAFPPLILSLSCSLAPLPAAITLSSSSAAERYYHSRFYLSRTPGHHTHLTSHLLLAFTLPLPT